ISYLLNTSMEIGLIGFGYWGTNILRVLLEITQNETIHVCDINPERSSKLISFFPKVKFCTDYTELANNADIKAVIIATPTASHYTIAKTLLEKGKHLLIEKPLTDNFSEAKELVQLAGQKNLCLMVDHIYLYNGAVAK